MKPRNWFMIFGSLLGILAIVSLLLISKNSESTEPQQRPIMIQKNANKQVTATSADFNFKPVNVAFQNIAFLGADITLQGQTVKAPANLRKESGFARPAVLIGYKVMDPLKGFTLQVQQRGQIQPTIFTVPDGWSKNHRELLNSERVHIALIISNFAPKPRITVWIENKYWADSQNEYDAWPDKL